MSLIRKVIVPLAVLALVVAAGFTLLAGDESRTITARFPRTISLYEGSDVRVLGVPVGKVDSVTPSGTDVIVKMHYDADVKIPSDAKAIIIAPSIVGDRFVQLTPVYKKGPTLKDGAVLATDRTAVPLELDQVYSSLDTLTVALGPNGANSNGALTDLLESTAKNFGGEGAKLKQTIVDFGRLSETLDDNKEELFGSAAKLEGFISTLAKNDSTVQSFNESLGQVSTELSGEKEELAASLKNLSIALGNVADFVKTNRSILGRNIKSLNRVAKVLVKQRSALAETLTNAPLALSNLALTYNPQAGTLDTNANLGELGNQIGSNPDLVLCTIANQVDTSGSLCDLIGTVLPRTGTFGEGLGIGTGTSVSKPFDPTLGGLVGVEQ